MLVENGWSASKSPTSANSIAGVVRSERAFSFASRPSAQIIVFGVISRGWPLTNAAIDLPSPSLREVAGLDKEVMLVGQGTHFELWSMEAWRAQLAEVMQDDSFEMPSELEGFSL